MTFIKSLLSLWDVVVFLRAHTIWHLGEVLEVSACDLHFLASHLLVHLKEPLHLLVDGLHDMFGHSLAFEVFEELLYESLLLIGLLVEVLLEIFVDLCVLLLLLGLTFLHIVLVLKIGPDLQLVEEVSKK